jgi:uncharacterized SAM-dependent methyltransferase
MSRDVKRSSPSSFPDRLSELTRQLAARDSPLALGLWERGATVRIGRVAQAIKGVSRRIEDGYQYVGGFPAHMWRQAALDNSYKTLHYGIVTFPARWKRLKQHLGSSMHYVSIGPGTGEKDSHILHHLESLATSPIVYIPVDISADLLRMSLEVSVQNIDDEKIDVLPVELDITSTQGLDGLKEVIAAMTNGGPVLISLLGNTLANFRDDQAMLQRMATLLSSPDDMLLMELATAKEANDKYAQMAGEEYEGSVSFRNFVMAALTQYTNCTPESGQVIHQGRIVGDTIEVATLFTAHEPITVYVSDTDQFTLEKEEAIELYRTRKYPPSALQTLLKGFSVLDTGDTPYSETFGVTTSLLRKSG